MKHKFSIDKMLLSAIGYKGTFYPGIFANTRWKIVDGPKYGEAVADPRFAKYAGSTMTPLATESGTRKLREKVGDTMIFMPVKINEFEFPNAVISISGKKTIIETPMVGQQGAVKELIGMDDYEISISGVLVSDDGSYPESSLENFMKLWRKNEAVKLVSAIADMVTGTEDIVIKSVDFPPVGAFENAQVVNITAVTDNPFTLTIE